MIAQPTISESFGARLGRLYPLNSGCGTIATSRHFSRLVGSRSVDVWANVFGAKALVPLTDLVGRSMFFFGDLDPKVTWAVRRFCRRGDVTLDIGANLGLVSILMASIGAEVHAFEPNPRMIGYLNQTVARNPDLPITLHKTALGAADRELDLMIPEQNEGAASLKSLGVRRVIESVTVPVRRLDDYIGNAGVDRVDFIKIDVEGFEPQVFEGAQNVLRELRPRALVFEENDPSPKCDTFRILQSLGYSIFAIPKNLARNRLIEVDALGHRIAHDFVAVA